VRYVVICRSGGQDGPIRLVSSFREFSTFVFARSDVLSLHVEFASQSLIPPYGSLITLSPTVVRSSRQVLWSPNTLSETGPVPGQAYTELCCGLVPVQTWLQLGSRGERVRVQGIMYSTVQLISPAAAKLRSFSNSDGVKARAKEYQNRPSVTVPPSTAIYSTWGLS
jgi:hypothetical protein